MGTIFLVILIVVMVKHKQTVHERNISLTESLEIAMVANGNFLENGRRNNRSLVREIAKIV